MLSASGSGPPDGIQKGLIINGFPEEIHGPQLPCALTGLHIIAG
jgi:hypothetical protein